MTRVAISKDTILYALVGVLFAACIGVWVAVYAATPSGELTFAVLDIGQGDALFIESPTGVQVLIDGGPDSSVLRALPKVMGVFDRTLDAVIATHPDADHIAGLVDVLRRYEVGAFIEPGIPKPTATAKALLQEVAQEKIPRYTARRGMTLDLGGGAKLFILFPDHDVSGLASNNVNEGGVVARLVYGNASALLTADVPKFVEYQVATLEGANLESDVLKLGHHGSRTSTSDILLEMAKPSLAVISLGKNNKFGHPHQEVLDALERFGIPILRTDEEGTLIFRSIGETFMRVE